MVDGVIEAPLGRALHHLRAGLRPRRGVPARVRRVAPRARRRGRAFQAKYIDVDNDDYRTRGERPMSANGFCRSDLAEVCAVACAEAWRGGRRDPRQPDRPPPLARRPPRPRDVRAGPADHRRHLALMARLQPPRRRDRRGVDAVPPHLRHRLVRAPPRHDGRDSDRQLRQPEHRLHRRLRRVRARSSSGARRAGQHDQPPDQLLDPEPLVRTFVAKVDSVSGVGYDRAEALGADARASTRFAAS